MQSQIRKIEKGGEADPSELLRESKSRIQAILLLTSQLQDTSSTNEINLQTYLADLTRYLQQNTNYMEGAYRTNIQLKNTPPMEVGLASRLGLAVTELVLNVVKHADVPHKTLSIEAHYSNSFTYLRITDNGPGMIKRFTKSTGLLMVYSTITKQLHGEIRLMSEKRGTSQEIKIPT